MQSAANVSVDHYQYYPTGERLAAKAWAKFQNPIQHLCDPSAGKGHLIRYAQEVFPGLNEDELPWVACLDEEDSKQGRFKARLRTYARAKFEGVKNVSAVEINVAHHASLRELGAKIIGHDFMQVQSLGTVSQVIMNPPFAAGCAHVLHAWDCVYDAEIVAIVNAETVRNPFSADRRRLVQLIENHGSVEFLQEQFVDDVERTTDVEVALIYLQKSPGQYLNLDTLTGGLKRGENGAEEEIDPEVSNALALPGNFIQDTVSRFNRAVEFARKASEAQAVATYLQKSLGFTLEQMQEKGLDSSHREDLLSVRRESNADFAARYADLKQRAWAQIIRSSLLTSKLSNRARLQLESQAASIYELEFTLGNIHGFMAGVIASMGDIYQSMLLDMFDAIIERSEDNVTYYRAFYKSSPRAARAAAAAQRKEMVGLEGLVNNADAPPRTSTCAGAAPPAHRLRRSGAQPESRAPSSCSGRYGTGRRSRIFVRREKALVATDGQQHQVAKPKFLQRSRSPSPPSPLH